MHLRNSLVAIHLRGGVFTRAVIFCKGRTSFVLADINTVNFRRFESDLHDDG